MVFGSEWVTQDRAARELQVSDTVVKRLIRERILAATLVVAFVPWVIKREDLALPGVQQHCCWTPGRARSSRLITQGTNATTSVAARMRSRMSRLTTVSLTCSSLAARSCVTHSLPNTMRFTAGPEPPP